jgi:Mn-dependent DtxR family transcriptional regulator
LSKRRGFDTPSSPYSRQTEWLLFIFNYFTEHRYYPTQREIAKQMNLKTNSAAIYRNPLLKKGYVKKTGKSRNIHITKAGLMKLRLIEKSINKKDE